MALTVSVAESSDYDFIRKGTLNASRKKHFGILPHKPEQRDMMDASIYSLIMEHRFLDGLYAVPYVFWKQHSRIGFLVMTELFPGEGGNEIHLAFVSQKHQGKGYGSWMMDYILGTRQGQDIYARCAPASEQMYQMLLRRGFEYVRTTDYAYRILLRPGVVQPCILA